MRGIRVRMSKRILSRFSPLGVAAVLLGGWVGKAQNGAITHPAATTPAGQVRRCHDGKRSPFLTSTSRDTVAITFTTTTAPGQRTLGPYPPSQFCWLRL